jgi:type IV pilus assembly protein PilW
MYLLARNLTETREYTDDKTYTLGVSGGTANIVQAAHDHYKRHVFQSQVILRNPAGRIAP